MSNEIMKGKAEKFSKLIIIFLLDKIVNEDEVLPNDEELNKLNEVLQGKQVKPHLLKQYLSFDTKNRNYYRRIKDAFYTDEDTNQKFTIEINPDKVTNESNEEDDSQINEDTSDSSFYSSQMFSYIKDVVYSVIKRIRKQKLRTPKQIIVDGDIEKIIESELNRRFYQSYGETEQK